jgi:hypothetical protein
MLALFQVLDENHSGLLPAVKFRKALGCLGLSLRDEDVQAMLVDFGVKTTDLIDYEVRQHVYDICIYTCHAAKLKQCACKMLDQPHVDLLLLARAIESPDQLHT